MDRKGLDSYLLTSKSVLGCCISSLKYGVYHKRQTYLRFICSLLNIPYYLRSLKGKTFNSYNQLPPQTPLPARFVSPPHTNKTPTSVRRTRGRCSSDSTFKQPSSRTLTLICGYMLTAHVSSLFDLSKRYLAIYVNV